MFRTLLVPLDGSEEAERALPYAARLAVAAGGEIVLVRVVLAPPPSGLDWERQQLAAVTEAESYLASSATKLRTRGVQATTAAPYGAAPAKLLQTIAITGADAVVMATHGRTGLDHLVRGSVAEAVLAQSPVPVFLVHVGSGEAVAAPFDPGSARVLVPLDGSAFAEAALPIAVQLVGTTGELVLVSVAAPPDHVQRDERGRPRAYLDQQEESLTREAIEYLRHLVAQLEQANPGLRTTISVRVGEAAPGIVIATRDANADVVVMSTHGRTGIRRALMGSVAGEVLRTGHGPVVLVGPGAVRPAPQLTAADVTGG